MGGRRSLLSVLPRHKQLLWRRCCGGDCFPSGVFFAMGCKAGSLISLSRCLPPFRSHLHVRADATSSLLATLSPWQKGQKTEWHCHRDFSYMEPHRKGKGVGKMCLKKSQFFNFDIFIELWRGEKIIHIVSHPNLLLLSLFPFFYLLGCQKRL